MEITGQIIQVGTVTASSVQLKAFTNGGTTPADAIINVIVVGDGQGVSRAGEGGRLPGRQVRRLAGE